MKTWLFAPSALIEHVPKEQKLQYFEEPCIQNIQAKHHQDSAIDSSPEVVSPNHTCLDSAVESVAVISPPEEPAILDQEAAAPDILIYPVEPFSMVPTFSEDEPEENKEDEEMQQPIPDPLKEGNMCEQQEGLSTQQVQNSPQHHRMLHSHTSHSTITTQQRVSVLVRQSHLNRRSRCHTQISANNHYLLAFSFPLTTSETAHD